MAEFRPIPDTSGALEPPRRFPPTAVGAATPEPVPPPRPSIPQRRARPSPVRAALLLAAAIPLLTVKVAVRAARRLVEAGR